MLRMTKADPPGVRVTLDALSVGLITGWVKLLKIPGNAERVTVPLKPLMLVSWSVDWAELPACMKSCDGFENMLKWIIVPLDACTAT